jgi:hypothetical protein
MPRPLKEGDVLAANESMYEFDCVHVLNGIIEVSERMAQIARGALEKIDDRTARGVNAHAARVQAIAQCWFTIHSMLTVLNGNKPVERVVGGNS